MCDLGTPGAIVNVCIRLCIKIYLILERASHRSRAALPKVQKKTKRVISSFPHSPKANRTNPLVLLYLQVITPNILLLHKPCYSSQKMRDWSGLILGLEGMGK
jgi:hypothetical protein